MDSALSAPFALDGEAGHRHDRSRVGFWAVLIARPGRGRWRVVARLPGLQSEAVAYAVLGLTASSDRMMRPRGGPVTSGQAAPERFKGLGHGVGVGPLAQMGRPELTQAACGCHKPRLSDRLQGGQLQRGFSTGPLGARCPQRSSPHRETVSSRRLLAGSPAERGIIFRRCLAI